MLLRYKKYIQLTCFFSFLLCIYSSSIEARTLIMIEGNGGAGKSTLSSLIEHELDALIIEEPVQEWQSIGGTGNLLDLYYNNRERWAFTMLNYVCFTVLRACLAADQKRELQVCDRSIYAGYYCFSKLMLEHGTITPLEWQIYKEQFAWYQEQLPCKPDGFIYVRTTPDYCLERMRVRGRPEEASVTLEFLEGLHYYHEQWLINKVNISPTITHVPVLVLDGNLDFKNDPIVQRLFVDNISQFIQDIKDGKRRAHG